MPGSSSPSKTTTTSEPPKFIQPFMQFGAEQAKGLYNQGAQVVPFSPQTEQAMQMTQQRALSGSPLNRSAQDYVQKSLQGGFMGSNPYLDQTFNRAAMSTQNQLASEFAGNGRNIGASEPIRSQQLNDLATGIYGGAYENERNRQQGVVPYAGSLANQDYFDIGQLANVGGQVEGLAREYADAPQQALDRYAGRISGAYPGGSSTQTSPNYRNTGAGMLGGAMAGNLLFPGLGGIIGGGLLGGFL